MVDLLTAIILVVDFVISIWNSYTAGYNLGLAKRHEGPDWMFIYAAFGLLLGIVGTIYVLVIVIGLVAVSLGYIGPATIDVLLAYNFLVFGGLITLLGVGVTIQTWYVAIKTHNKWSIVASLWNTFASIWNVWSYISNFGLATSIIKSESKEENEGGLIIILALAVVIAAALSYLAYRAGSHKAQTEAAIATPGGWNAGTQNTSY